MNKSLIFITAYRLAEHMIVTGTPVTSLDLKELLRLHLPLVKWNQDLCSQVLKQVQQDYSDDIISTDNGTYLTYTLAPTLTLSVEPKFSTQQNDQLVPTITEIDPSVPVLPRQLAIDALKTAQGTFFKASFIKMDGSPRTLNCQIKTLDDGYGFILVRTGGKSDYKRIHPERITQLIIKKVKYDAQNNEFSR